MEIVFWCVSAVIIDAVKEQSDMGFFSHPKVFGVVTFLYCFINVLLFLSLDVEEFGWASAYLTLATFFLKTGKTTHNRSGILIPHTYLHVYFYFFLVFLALKALIS